MAVVRIRLLPLAVAEVLVGLGRITLARSVVLVALGQR
jgi:hypothetical protein